MRQLHYNAGIITVGFSVCDALFEYTVALANASRTDRVTVPVWVDGEVDFSNLLLGPTTQLYCSPGPDDEKAPVVQLDDDALIEELRRKTRMLRGGTPLAPSDGIGVAIDLSDLD